MHTNTTSGKPSIGNLSATSNTITTITNAADTTVDYFFVKQTSGRWEVGGEEKFYGTLQRLYTILYSTIVLLAS